MSHQKIQVFESGSPFFCCTFQINQRQFRQNSKIGKRVAVLVELSCQTADQSAPNHPKYLLFFVLLDERAYFADIKTQRTERLHKRPISTVYFVLLLQAIFAKRIHVLLVTYVGAGDVLHRKKSVTH